jgi:uncharacterized protein (DUF302 family)
MGATILSGMFRIVLAAAAATAVVQPAQAQEVKFTRHKGTAIYTYATRGKFDDLLTRLKTSLEARQFTIVAVSDLSAPLEKNRALFREFNKLGHDQVRSVLLCSLELNNEALNTDLNLAALCPFKVAVYSKKGSDEVTFAFPGTEALLEGSRDKRFMEIARKVDSRLRQAIEDSLP